MKEHDLDQLLDDILREDVPEPDVESKQRAIQLSKSEFIRQNRQGFERSTRPIDNQGNFFLAAIKSIGSSIMNFSTNKTVNTAFGTVAVAFVAISALILLPPLQKNELYLENKHYVESGDLLPASDGRTDSDSNAGDGVDKSDPLLEENIVPAYKLPTPEPAVNTSAPEQINEIVTSVIKPKILPFEAPQYRAEREFERTRQTSEKSDLKRKQSTAGALSNAADEISSRPLASAPALSSIAPPVPEKHLPYSEPRIDQNEEYAEYQASAIKRVADEPVSTFSIDVDTASYSLIRNQLNSGLLPKPQAVRAEELINYFDYDYPLPRSKKQPFEPSLSVFDSPWNEGKKLLHIGIKGYDIDTEDRPDSNIVFLLDVSGSMNARNKLPLVKQSVALLLDTLKPSDTISIAVYAGAAGTVLEPTQVKQKQKILNALSNLNAGGSTAGGAGIRLAYQLAEQNFDKNAVNRIILATDGDFNVGQQSNEDLKTLVERKRDSGVFLSILGFGRNNYQDDMMQTLAQNGNGIAAYIDTLSEAKKVLVDEATSTLFPIAKDVKIQIEFNPDTVSDYRLIGYETRKLNREDFNNDKVDAGDIGAGHTVTAIYELTPSDTDKPSVDKARYVANKTPSTVGKSDEFGFLKIRYKLPQESVSKLIESPIKKNLKESNGDAEFSIAVAGFAQLLASGKHTGNLKYDDVIALASKHKGSDPYGYRSEFIQLARMAKIAQP